jgi:hypothetical protein
MRHLLRLSRSRGDEGYSIVEAAITLPALVLLTMLIVQCAILWHTRHVAQAAAQEALRTAESYQSTAAAGRQDGLTLLRDVAPHALSHPVVTVTRTATTVRVHLHAQVSTVIPFASLTVDADASGPVERYLP